VWTIATTAGNDHTVLRSRKVNNAMAFQSVPNTIEVDVRGLLFGQKVENTLYLRTTAAPTAGDVADAAAAVNGWFVAHPLLHLSTDYIFQSTHAKDLTVEAGAEADDTANAGTTGSEPSASAPGNVSLAVSFRTGLAGRSFRGRNYIPGIPDDFITGNSVGSGTAAAYATDWAALLTALLDSEFTWVVVSRVADGVLREFGITTPIVSVIVTDVLLDSMRRRLTGRGQ